jgi:hypothetical protein
VLCRNSYTAFRERLVSPKDYQQLERVLTLYDEILQVDERCKHVRRVRFSGQVTFEAESVNQYFQEQQLRAWTNPDANNHNAEDSFSKPMSLTSFGGWKAICTAQNKSRANEAWQPAAQFLAKYAALRDIYWASTDQVLRCISEMLRKKLPRFRFHVHTFSLRSLYQSRDPLHDVDVDEYARATSPSLYSICVAAIYLDSNDNLDYNEEAALRIVAGAAPNSKSVCMWQQQAGHSLELLAAIQPPCPPWQGFFAQGSANTLVLQGQLWDLSFGGASCCLSLQRRQNWTSDANFVEMRSLDLSVRVGRRAFQKLIQMAMH